jgi:glycosyltransferase involved in cell wall biosynthesis
MNFAVDARWMVGQFRGMGRYAHALLEPLATDIVALLPRHSPNSNYVEIREGNSFFPYWEQSVLPRLCEKNKVKRLLCPYNTAPLKLPSHTELTLVVHDLIYLEPWSRLPPSVSMYQTMGRIYRRTIVPRAIERAQKLLTVSHYTRQKMVELFDLSLEDIEVIPNSLESDWYVDAPMPREQRKPYLLAVAGEAPSKNLPRLIQAFANFRDMLGLDGRTVTLRVVGIKQQHHAHFQRIASEFGVQQAVNFESFLDAPALRTLYREAWLFTMPSLYEGFGIPVLEAMASGTPVVCSNTTSLPEVVGDSGWMFDPRSVEDMTTTLRSAWLDNTELDSRAQLGIAQAARYSRSAVAHQIASFWGVRA